VAALVARQVGAAGDPASVVDAEPHARRAAEPAKVDDAVLDVTVAHVRRRPCARGRDGAGKDCGSEQDLDD
jgi:hypothetical protein